MGNKNNRKSLKDTTTSPEIKQGNPDTLKAAVEAFRASVARIVEESRELVEAHRKMDDGLTQATDFWEKRKPEIAAVYRELRDALREADVSNIPVVFMDGTTTARIRAMARRRRDKRDELAEKVRVKATELQAKKPWSQRALRTYLARNSEKLFGTKLSESTIRRYIEKAGDT